MEWIMVAMPLALLILGVPIYAILAATAAVLLLLGDIPGAAIHQNMFGGVDKFPLMAVPFFIYAG